MIIFYLLLFIYFMVSYHWFLAKELILLPVFPFTHKQVVIGGRNKYMINGTTVQNSRVQDFFRSVQLNVNNPHFLIMQGRITKVLNMKPPEVC